MILWASAALAATVSVEVVGARSSRGVIACELFRAADGFPGDAAKASGRDIQPIVDGRATCRFTGVDPGQVAVAVIHDENGNLVLDTAWYGAPVEGYGFSNGAKAHAFSPARFDEAAFSVTGDATVTVPLVY